VQLELLLCFSTEQGRWSFGSLGHMDEDGIVTNCSEIEGLVGRRGRCRDQGTRGDTAVLNGCRQTEASVRGNRRGRPRLHEGCPGGNLLREARFPPCIGRCWRKSTGRRGSRGLHHPSLGRRRLGEKWVSGRGDLGTHCNKMKSRARLAPFRKAGKS
jgi:hypothetical protein